MTSPVPTSRPMAYVADAQQAAIYGTLERLLPSKLMSSNTDSGAVGRMVSAYDSGAKVSKSLPSLTHNLSEGRIQCVEALEYAYLCFFKIESQAADSIAVNCPFRWQKAL